MFGANPRPTYLRMEEWHVASVHCSSVLGVRGHIVSEHAKRIICNFLCACSVEGSEPMPDMPDEEEVVAGEKS